jgi:hypothetical protein
LSSTQQLLCALLVECLVSAHFYSVWQQLPYAQELSCTLLSVSESLQDQGAATCCCSLGGKNITCIFLRNPVSAGCAGYLPVKSSTYMLTAPHSCLKCLVFKLLLYWQGKVLLFFKHLGFANFSFISNLNFTVLSTLQQSCVVN